jgi:hypothetical protein
MDCAIWSALVCTADSYVTLPDPVPFGLPIHTAFKWCSNFIFVTHSCGTCDIPNGCHYSVLMKPSIDRP